MRKHKEINVHVALSFQRLHFNRANLELSKLSSVLVQLADPSVCSAGAPYKY